MPNKATMKIERLTRGSPNLDKAAEPDSAPNVLGIPDKECTPKVREAIDALTRDIHDLRRELEATRAKLEAAEKNADQDDLLPLLNRRAFVRALTRRISFVDRYHTPSSLIYFDLNNFKLVNDAHGHAGGDAVLRQFASVLIANVRDTDIVGRVGGDEFAILLVHADQAQAHKKADQLAEQVRTSPAVWNGQSIALSFAYGAFELKSGDNPEEAMARADEAMYRHKRGAR
jgi:diguanylate cyclase (GGDEF)-like protein